MNNNNKQECVLADINKSENGTAHKDDERSQPLFNDLRSMLQMQMEVQRKLQEQIEVQKHLQLCIEAQGKYLQSVLMKAEETLKGYRSGSTRVDAAEAELSELAADCSTDSCLTSSERPETKDGKRRKLETTSYKWIEEPDEINRDSSRTIEMQCNDDQQASICKRLLHQTGNGFVMQEELDINRY